uniref:Katanin p80 WD40 repeat-containing subunit B1 n=1 Tax=Gouania willdenowi TaxID=441366 RepID=A0A8C5EA07_GOUWI
MSSQTLTSMAAAVPSGVSSRLYEFVAHSGSACCTALTKSSSRLLATGGDDCKINLWSVSNAKCIMSLSGHKSPVECIQFKESDEQLASGSQSGTLQVWDVEAAKVLRTLVGHRANITSLSFHPYGFFLASSSMDTNIKGHTQAVRSLAFSPDGKWLASASDDSTVKLWDLTLGKTITEFTSHSAAVNTIQFHPNEYLLASGSADRTVKLWDLEKFTMVGSLEKDTTPVRCVHFSLDGSCLFSGSTDSLRVFGWEPDRCFDVVSVGWGKVSELSVSNQQLVGVAHQASMVSLYAVDLKKVKMTGSAVIQGSAQQNEPSTEPKGTKGVALRRNYVRPTTTCSTQRLKQHIDADRRSPEGERRSPSEDEQSSAEIHDMKDYNMIFQPKNPMARTPPKMSELFLAPAEEVFLPISRPHKDRVFHVPEKQQHKAPPAAASTSEPRAELPVVAPPPAVPRSSHLPSPPSQTSAPSARGRSHIIPSSRNEPVGLNIADFLPSPPNEHGFISEEDALSQITKGHQTMIAILSSRHKNLQNVRMVWARDDLKSAFKMAVSMNDFSIVVDILNIINNQTALWKLDLCTEVLPQVEKLLQSKYESYVQTGCSSLRLIMNHFWPLITDTLKATPSVGVDITREERHQRCQLCCDHLKKLSVLVKAKASQVGRNGSTFWELQLLMVPLDDTL